MTTYDLWRRLRPLPLGNRLFSVATWVRVPYFRTVLPTVTDLRPGRCEARAPRWWGVHNHLGTFHAIAACNLAEYAMGLLAEATVPPTHRWLPKAMTVEYLAKATTGLTAVAALDPLPEFGDTGVDLPVPVELRDRHGTVVVRATITIWVTPRPTRT
ncbi:MAG TPA: hotdog fold domain-containing protein [Pseudonocardiaceae bacterium]